MLNQNLGNQLPNLEEFLESNFLTVSPKISIIEAIAKMDRSRQIKMEFNTDKIPKVSRSSCILVLAESVLVGILTEKDIVRLSAIGTDFQTKVGDVMTKNVITLNQRDFGNIERIMSIINQHQIRHLPIVGDGGDVRGIISLDRIARVLNPIDLLKLRSVADMVNSDVVRAKPTASVLELSRLMVKKQQSCVVIVEPSNSEREGGEKPVGIVTERNIVQFQILGLDFATTPAQTVMNSSLEYVRATASWLEVWQKMNRQVQIIVVTKESGRLEGIIGIEDLLKVCDLSELYRVVNTLKQELNQQNKYLQCEVEQRRVSEKLLQRHQQLLRLFVRHTPAAIAMVDRNMRYLAVSDRWITDYQLQDSNLIGKTHYEVFPELPQRWKQDHQDMLAGKVKVLKKDRDSFKRLSGRIDWLRWELRPWHNLQGQIGGLIMFSEVITDQELAEITLRSIGDAIITTDAFGKVNGLNPVAEELTGWSMAEVRGKHINEFFTIVNQSTREPVPNPINLVLQKNEVFLLAAETILIAKDGTEYAIEDSAAPIQDRQGNLVGAIMVFRDVTESRHLSQKLSWQASHDPLTKLYNRHKFEQELETALQDVRENQTHHVLCYLDLDRFKIVNDTCGHAAGDELLKQLAQLFQQRIRASDIFARLGGDEFGILLRGCPLEIARKITEQLRQSIQDFRFAHGNKVFKIGVSIGLVAIDSSIADLDSALNKADAACYAAKNNGRNCVYIYQEQDKRFIRQKGEQQWMQKLNLALEKNQFCLYAQKIVNITSNSNSANQSNYYHHEILLRLVDESRQLITPGTFIPAAERYDLMPAIDRWVIGTFLASYETYLQTRQKQKKELPNNMYTINLSGASINDREFGSFLLAQLERYAVLARNICFEITETVAISNFQNTIVLIEQLKKLGCSIALDDFGSGMSSFNYLKNLPVDYLKIDGSFVKNIASDRLNYATVECFNHISQIMNIKTIAEFVEDDLILQNLRKIGVDYAQGFGIERPQPLVFNHII